MDKATLNFNVRLLAALALSMAAIAQAAPLAPMTKSAPTATEQPGKLKAEPKPNPEVVADCVTVERIDPPMKEASFVFSKFHLLLADGTREVREIAIDQNEKFRNAKVGDRFCARPVVLDPKG